MNRMKILSCAGAIALTGFVGIAWAIGANDSSAPYAFRHALLGKLVEVNSPIFCVLLSKNSVDLQKITDFDFSL